MKSQPIKSRKQGTSLMLTIPAQFCVAENTFFEPQLLNDGTIQYKPLPSPAQIAHDRALIEQSFDDDLLDEKQMKAKFKKYGWQWWMKVKYTNHFAQSLQQIIFYWINNLHISKDKVQRFVRQIEYKIDLLKHFPKMGQDVTELYQLERPTYRLLIGKSYEIFYRIDKQHQLIIIGSIFSADQMKIKF